MHVKLPISDDCISPTDKWELDFRLKILYFLWLSIGNVLWSHEKDIGSLPRFTVQDSSVLSPISRLGGINNGLSTGASSTEAQPLEKYAKIY